MAKPIYPFPVTVGYRVRRGERHGLVMIIQVMLEVLTIYYDSFTMAGISGIYDLATENAVRSFQKINSLGESGEVDLETWDRLAEEFNSVVKENQ